jgi:hypothetical protein
MVRTTATREELRPAQRNGRIVAWPVEHAPCVFSCLGRASAAAHLWRPTEHTANGGPAGTCQLSDSK